jgi:hypothetical protein
LWALYWQFFERLGSGSLLDPHSGTFGLTRFWAGLDPWLLLGGLALVPFAAFVRRLRPLAFAFGLQVLVLVKGGYVPYAYVTAMLPFAALLIAGMADTWWTPLTTLRRARHAPAADRTNWWFARIGRVPVMAGIVAFGVVVAPGWWHSLASQANVHGDAIELAATAWIEHHAPSGAVVVVDDYMWPDLKMHSNLYPVWLWKVNTDPWVNQTCPSAWVRQHRLHRAGTTNTSHTGRAAHAQSSA